MAYRQGRISKSDVAEGISMVVANVGSDAADLTRLQMQIKTIELELSEPEPQARTEIGGVYVYIMAKISQFVLKSQAPGWVRTVQEKAGASMAAALHFPAAEIADATVPMMVELFVLFVHAFGLEHLHTVGPFVHRVVHESVLMHDYTWSYAFELLIIYLKVLDERRSNVSMGSIWDSGSQDTFSKNAEKAARQRWGANFVFFRTHEGNLGSSAASTCDPAVPGGTAIRFMAPGHALVPSHMIFNVMQGLFSLLEGSMSIGKYMSFMTYATYLANLGEEWRSELCWMWEPLLKGQELLKGLDTPVDTASEEREWFRLKWWRFLGALACELDDPTILLTAQEPDPASSRPQVMFELRVDTKNVDTPIEGLGPYLYGSWVLLPHELEGMEERIIKSHQRYISSHFAYERSLAELEVHRLEHAEVRASGLPPPMLL